MDINDTEAVLAAINEASGSSTACEVHTYTLERSKQVDDQTHYQTVSVEILDRGPAGSPRYFISGTSDDGKRFAGNSEDDLRTAILLAHWFDLDK